MPQDEPRKEVKAPTSPPPKLRPRIGGGISQVPGVMPSLGGAPSFQNMGIVPNSTPNMGAIPNATPNSFGMPSQVPTSSAQTAPIPTVMSSATRDTFDVDAACELSKVLHLPISSAQQTSYLDGTASSAMKKQQRIAANNSPRCEARGLANSPRGFQNSPRAGDRGSIQDSPRARTRDKDDDELPDPALVLKSRAAVKNRGRDFKVWKFRPSRTIEIER